MTRHIKRLFELGARVYVFIMLMQYGIGKIIGQQFYRKGKLPENIIDTTLGNVETFDLAWTFMGHSFYYILFIGLSQIIGSILLLFNKTKLLGVTILIPIMLNIIVFDIIFLNAYGALASAILYFILLISILIINKKQVISAIKNLMSTIPTENENIKQKRLVHVGIVILIVGLIFVIDQFFVNLIGHGVG